MIVEEIEMEEIVMTDCMPRRLWLREQAQNTGEKPDPTPVEASMQQPPLTLREEMRRFIKQELSSQAEAKGQETFEEADDFEMSDDDELDLSSEYTVQELTEADGMPDDLDGAPTEEDEAAAAASTPAEPAEPAEGTLVEPGA